MIPKTIYILTESFPFGRGEAFLKDEVYTLSKYFEKIILLPRFSDNNPRPLPENCVVNEMLSGISKSQILKSLIENVFFVGKIKESKLTFNIFRKHFFRSLRYCFGVCVIGRIIADRLEKAIEGDPILYAYWFKHSAYALSLLDSSHFKIVRGHGSDIYEYKYEHPFHRYISERVNHIFTISSFGKKYLIDNYEIPQSKISIARLGTVKHENLQHSQEESFLIVSCSNCIPIKRVDSILKAVYELAKSKPNTKYRYIHIGDGPLLKSLSGLANHHILDNLTIEFKGHMKNEKVHGFYAQYRVNCFVNFSTTEGIPVSIMEALSYGIPIVASNVGGNHEIVNSENGIVIDSASTEKDLSSAIDTILSGYGTVFLKETIISFWEKNYSADINYTEFTQTLKKKYSVWEKSKEVQIN